LSSSNRGERAGVEPVERLGLKNCGFIYLMEQFPGVHEGRHHGSALAQAAIHWALTHLKE